jgi:hypothetical protein
MTSFSVCGAWLGDRPDKQVIAPEFKIAEGITWWGFAGLLPRSGLSREDTDSW